MRATGLAICLIVLAGGGSAAAQVPIKDLADWQGIHVNHLTGVGLVVGLQGTGDKSKFTQRVVADMLQRFDIVAATTQQEGTNLLKTGNASVVMVTAKLGSFARKGSTIDVTVSALDSAKSIDGGTLIRTELKGPDGVTYAVAQGTVSSGGVFASAPAGAGAALATAQKNHPTVGHIPNGATVEIEVLGKVVCEGSMRLMLRYPDFKTAQEIAKAINRVYPASAVAIDAGAVQVAVPPKYLHNFVPFAATIGELKVVPSLPARVVIDSRNGSIVAGHGVQVELTAVAHGNLFIATHTELIPSQPRPFSEGKTQIVPRSSIDVQEQGGKLSVLPQTTSVQELARAMQALGASPRDLITIFQMLKRAGALHAELVTR